MPGNEVMSYNASEYFVAIFQNKLALHMRNQFELT